MRRKDNIMMESTREELLIDEIIDAVEETTGNYELVVFNDDVNTFDWVILSLKEICGHSATQAEQCTLLIHFKGQCTVKTGEEPKLMGMQDALMDRGISASLN